MFKFISIIALATIVAATPELNHLCRGKPDGSVFTNPSNCNAYITCVGSHAVQQFCQTGLHYNDRAHYCDYPENVNCSPSGPGGPQDPEQPEKRPEPKCAGSNPHNPTKLPHEWDCSKFYVCDSGFAITMSCPMGTHFNRRESMCDFPENAGCQVRSS